MRNKRSQEKQQRQQLEASVRQLQQENASLRASVQHSQREAEALRTMVAKIRQQQPQGSVGT